MISVHLLSSHQILKKKKTDMKYIDKKEKEKRKGKHSLVYIHLQKK